MRDPKAIRKAIMTAKSIASLVDPKFARVPLPDLGAPAPQEYVPEHSPAMHEAFGVPMPKGYAGGGEVEDENPYTQPNDLGFYSHAAATAAELPQERGTPEQFRGMLFNKGVKPDEIRWSEYDNAFADKPQVTRDEVAKHFWQNMPPIEELVFQGSGTKGKREEMNARHSGERWRHEQKYKGSPEGKEELLAMRRRHAEERKSLPAGDAQHESYTIPGGENYREVLLQHSNDKLFGGDPHHFAGTPSILASLRMKDRQDADGDKILHLDELQSDWGQEAKKAGTYSPKEHQQYLRDLEQRAAPLVAEEFGIPESTARAKMPEWTQTGYLRHHHLAEMLGEEDEFDDRSMEDISRRNESVAEAPYIGKTEGWLNLGLKRALLEAAKNGHDKLAWTPGDTQADRYPGGTEEQEAKRRAGMIQFYDKMLPKALLKLAKMHDPEAELTRSVIDHHSYHEFANGDREEGSDAYSGPTVLPALRITPKMRESIMKHGFPAHARGGAVDGYAQGGEVESYADGGEIDPELFKQFMKRIHTPFSDDPESVRKALSIAGSYRAPTGMETGVGSLYNIKQSMPASAVTRTIQDIPGVNLKPKNQGSWEDFYDLAKGNEFVNVGGDLSGFGRLTHINGKELAWPVDLHAGADYMREPNPGRVWANIGAHATGFQTKIREANERGKELYGILSPMGPSAVNSSHNMFDTLMAQIPNSGIDKDHLKEFDEAIKRGDHLNPKIKRNPKLFASYLKKLEKWPGLEDAKEVSEFARPWKGNLTGAHRADIVKFMDKSYWRDRGFPEVGVTRAAITNPDLLGAGGNKLGYRVVKLSADPTKGDKSIFKHLTYPVDTFGEYVMDVPLVQRHYAQPDVIERLIKSPTKAGQIVHPYSEDPMGRSTARKLFEEQKQIQPVTQRFLDSVMTGMENQSKYGFKKGGSVRKALMIAKTTKKK